jgi:hypothetical protein
MDCGIYKLSNYRILMFERCPNPINYNFSPEVYYQFKYPKIFRKNLKSLTTYGCREFVC